MRIPAALSSAPPKLERRFLHEVDSGRRRLGDAPRFPVRSAPKIPRRPTSNIPARLKLAVDATDLDHRVFRVREEIPVAAGALTLLYPQWLPGNHAPRGPIDKLAGLDVHGDGKPLAWTRDPVDVYAFHVDVPQGATTLDRANSSSCRRRIRARAAS